MVTVTVNDREWLKRKTVRCGDGSDLKKAGCADPLPSSCTYTCACARASVRVSILDKLCNICRCPLHKIIRKRYGYCFSYAVPETCKPSTGLRMVISYRIPKRRRVSTILRVNCPKVHEIPLDISRSVTLFIPLVYINFFLSQIWLGRHD